MQIADIPKVKAGTAARKEMRSLDELDQERLYLATRAADLLGYKTLTADVTGDRKIGVSSGQLTEVLVKLGFEVLDTASVIDYQLEEAARQTKELIKTRFRDWATGYFTAAGWTKTEISEYEHPIPEFVLSKAVKIKEELSDVQFIVQHMTNPKADPFLVATCGKEIYYIEAWDEPRFEGRAASDWL